MTSNYIKRHNEMQAEIYNEILDIVNKESFNMFHIHSTLVPECSVMAFDIKTRTYNEYIVESIFVKDMDIIMLGSKNGETLDLNDCDILSMAKLHETMVMQSAELEKNSIKNDERLKAKTTHSKRMFIVPNEFLNGNEDDTRFMTLAWHKGLVLTPEEYASAHNNYGLGVCVPEHSTIRVYDFTDTIIEYCPHCESEVVLESKFAVQTCPVCKNKISPCNLCDTCLGDCPLTLSLKK